MAAMLNYSFLNSAHAGGGFNTKLPYNNKPPYMKGGVLVSPHMTDKDLEGPDGL